jgi:CrcB protein
VRLVLICLGGALGTGLRYLVTGVAARGFGPAFPYGTLAVNVLGSFLIGLVQEIALTTLVPAPTVRLFLTVGVLGGFTTYSSFSYETVRLLEEGSWLRAGLNVGVTTVACLGACVLGLATGRACVAFREGG